jgi:hypothetical protein
MAYTGKVAMGLSKIEVGTPVSGGEATSYATLGYTDPDSCTLDTEDPETTDINAEEADDPIYSISKGGKSTLNFNVLNPLIATLTQMMGGTVDQTTGDWEAPTQLTQPELSVKITMESGHIFRFPRVKFFCKYSGSFGKSEPIKLTCTGSVLIPTDGETAKMLVTMPSA